MAQLCFIEPVDNKTMKYKRFLWLLLCLSQYYGSAQQLTPEQLRADFARFRTALNEVHPEMYRYTPKATFDSLFSIAAGRLTEPMTSHEFYVTMTPLLVALRDGHVKWIPAGQDEHYPFQTNQLFPLKLYFLDQQAWVIASYGLDSIPAGAELTAINGQPIATIIQRLLPQMTFADGATNKAKYGDLNQFFSGYYATFVEASPSFAVAYRLNEEDKITTLPAVTLDRIKNYVEAHKPATQPPFRLVFKDNRTAVMTLERFWSDKTEPDFRRFLKTSFRAIGQQGVQNLVLDLRNNEGGEEKYGVWLARYLSESRFRYYDFIRVRQKKSYSFPAWTPKLYQQLKWLLVRKKGSDYVFTAQKGLNSQRPRRATFRGNLFVLINGNSFSVTTELAARLHADRGSRSGQTVFVGDETGGGYAGNSSGIFTVTQLPHSKIDLGIPMFGFHMANLPANRQPGQGIRPDHFVVPTVEDVLTGNDRVMQYTLELIRKAPQSTSAITATK